MVPQRGLTEHLGVLPRLMPDWQHAAPPRRRQVTG